MSRIYEGDALVSLAEAIYDIGRVVGDLNESMGYPFKDSRSIPLYVLELAEEFEKAHPKEMWDDVDYLETVQAYAKAHFLLAVKGLG
jgi:hypothetical protein